MPRRSACAAGGPHGAHRPRSRCGRGRTRLDRDREPRHVRGREKQGPFNDLRGDRDQSITSGATHHERHEHLERPHDQQDLQRREHQRAQQPRRARHVGEPVADVHEQGSPVPASQLDALRDLSSCRDIPRVKGGVHVDESDGTDAELLERLASGDQWAMPVVFDRHAPAVTRYAWESRRAGWTSKRSCRTRSSRSGARRRRS